MNELMKQQILDDYREVLASEAGKRVFGGIFDLAGLNHVGTRNDYQQGYHSLAGAIANTIRQADPLGVARCEIAYAKFEEDFKDNGRDSSESYTGTDEWRA